MDPATAFFQFATKLLDVIHEVIKGQPPEVRDKIWEWYVADVDRWRQFWKLDK